MRRTCTKYEVRAHGIDYIMRKMSQVQVVRYAPSLQDVPIRAGLCFGFWPHVVVLGLVFALNLQITGVNDSTTYFSKLD